MPDNQIIIIKKKGGHAGHHGGAWKVAYADFVTAMMALFIVLWLLNTSKPVQEAIGGYFRDPNGTASKKGTSLAGAQAKEKEMSDDLKALKEELMKNLEKMEGFDKLKKQIEIKVTPEGLRIELIESAKGTFFENGKAQPTPVLHDLLKILAAETGKLPNPISIEGHTDANPFTDPSSYSNWELSTDRANAARRLMEQSGLHKAQVVQVRGYADHNLRKPDAPADPSNRRISIIIQYMPQSAPLPSTEFNGKLSPPTPPAQKAAGSHNGHEESNAEHHGK